MYFSVNGESVHLPYESHKDRSLWSRRSLIEVDYDVFTDDVSSEPFSVRIAIAWDEKTPFETLWILSKDEVDIRRHVADNPSTPPEMIEKISKDPSKTVKNLIAQRSGVSKKILKRLSRDEDEYIRASVANNRSTPIPLLTEFILLRSRLQ